MADTSALIPPSALKRFLAANRWSIIEDHANEWEIWRPPQDLKSLAVTLLFDDEYVDYTARLHEANDIIMRAYHMGSIELSEKITSLSADLFFFRIVQDSRDGTIPFKQAQRALESIATMVRAAATTAVNPNHSHRGRRPSEVDQFIAEDLRLGHTKKGSFVVTAAARFDPEEIAPAPMQTNVPVSAGPSPFSRRVMTVFSRGLEAARAMAVDEESVLGAVEQGLSLELAEALERISDEVGLQTIEVSFDWSEAVPKSTSTPELVRFDRAALDSLPRVTEQLQERRVPEVVEVIGQVTGLSRRGADDDTAASGEVTITGELGGQVRKVVVELDGEAHEYAIRAYRERFPIIVSGELVKRRSWRLEGYVAMDVEAARLMATRHRQAGELADSPPDFEPSSDEEGGGTTA